MSSTPRPSDAGRAAPRPTLVVGVLFIAAGLLLTFDRLGHVDAGALVAGWWPLAIVGAGLWWMLVDRAPVAGGIGIAAGAAVLLVVRDAVDAGVSDLLVPIVLAGAGIGALTAAARVRRPVDDPAEPTRAGASAGPPTATTATAVFGDARLALSDGASDRAVVTALSVFGDVEVAAPAGWRVVDRSTALFGSVRIPADQPPYAEAPVVELHGLAVFGDVQVRYLEDDPRSEP